MLSVSRHGIINRLSTPVIRSMVVPTVVVSSSFLSSSGSSSIGNKTSTKFSTVFNGVFTPVRYASSSSGTFKSFTHVFEVNTQTRMEFVNITAQVQAFVTQSGIKEGLLLCNTMHTSSSVFIDDADEGLYKDFEAFANRVAPWDPIEQYRHNVNGEVNGAAHIQRTVFGREVTVAITEGKLHLGKWESIHYGEFDGKRAKKLLVKIIGH